MAAQTRGDHVVGRRLDAHEAVVAAGARVFLKKVDLGRGRMRPARVGQIARRAAVKNARRIDKREEGEIQALADVGIDCEALDEVEQREGAVEIAVIEAGVKREAQRLIVRVRAEVHEARQVEMAGFVVERPERRTEDVVGTLR